MSSSTGRKYTLTRLRTKSRAGYLRVLTDIGYEILPLKGTFENVLMHVPAGVPITVTASPQKGISATVELTVALALEGHIVVPHLSARLIRDQAHLKDLLDQLRDADVSRLFVVGGDGQPLGSYPDAISLLRDIHETGEPFGEIGIGGYPDGHPLIPDAVLRNALREKAPLAHYITTQMCFDAQRVRQWAAALPQLGVDLPVRVGAPGVVSRQKLLRVSAAIGVGDSARYLKKQQNLLWRFFMPGGFRPAGLMRQLAPNGQTPAPIEGFHLFTFNDLEGTERWRRRQLSRLAQL